MSARRKKQKGTRFAAGVLFSLVAAIAFCIFFRPEKSSTRSLRATSQRDPTVFTVTGYCNCGECCGWRRSFFGLGPAVYNYGKMKGKIKKIGLTSSGKIASRGTVAADMKQFKYGEKLHIPGYGIGRVEDTGGAIKGRHIDVWFPTHKEALEWGVKHLRVTRIVK